jgi:hypothetical protein
MNIFVLDKHPFLAAQYQCDKHVVKMCVETTQLLSTTMWECGQQGPYKSTHKNHPCTIWVRQSHQNFVWLANHGLGLCKEYTFRYGKVHACSSKIHWILCHFKSNLPYLGITPFALAMPDEYKTDDAVESYRNYYIGAKSDIAKWNKSRPEPDWYTNARTNCQV